MQPNQLPGAVTMTGASKDDLLHQLDAADIHLNVYAQELFALPEFVVSPGSQQLHIQATAVEELGLKGPTSNQIASHIQSLGLAPCPLELAVYLRLSWLNQPEGKRLTVFSSKPVDDNELPNGFYLQRREDGLWLRGYRAPDDYTWPEDEVFIFCRQGRESD